MKYRNESGITLMVLVIMVIILMIIAGVSVYEGKYLIRDAKAQNIETNMYTIKTKSKVFAEDVAARTWTKDNSTDDTEREKIFQEEYKMVKTTVNNEYYNQLNNSINQDTNTAYEITNETLESYNLGFSGNYDELYRILRKEGFYDEEILEKCLPPYLKNDLNNLKEGLKNNVSYIDCLIDELQGSVNSAWVDGDISEEQCDYLYRKYIRMEKEHD